MFLLILESIGTSELLLVGIIALVIFGPRKLPELARKAGKMMNELRQVSNDFRSTWLKEVQLDEEEKNAFNFNEDSVPQNSIAPPELNESTQNTNADMDPAEPSAINSSDGLFSESGQSEKQNPGVPEIKSVEDSDQIERLKSAAKNKNQTGSDINEDTGAAPDPLDTGETEKRNWL